MARQARMVIPGVPHHVTQRGNRRERIFFEAGDEQIYLDMMAVPLKRQAVGMRGQEHYSPLFHATANSASRWTYPAVFSRARTLDGPAIAMVRRKRREYYSCLLIPALQRLGLAYG